MFTGPPKDDNSFRGFFLLLRVGQSKRSGPFSSGGLHQELFRPVRNYGWVLTEVADGWAKPIQRRTFFVPLLADLRTNADALIVSCTDQIWQEGIDLYANRPDKEWSLTDCISFIVMQKEGITEALTGDRHFEQAGFVALLK
jgi:uncharacterized protein